jgi:hypothetical protein
MSGQINALIGHASILRLHLSSHVGRPVRSSREAISDGDYRRMTLIAAPGPYRNQRTRRPPAAFAVRSPSSLLRAAEQNDQDVVPAGFVGSEAGAAFSRSARRDVCGLASLPLAFRAPEIPTQSQSPSTSRWLSACTIARSSGCSGGHRSNAVPSCACR